jgi:hypothetical protein
MSDQFHTAQKRAFQYWYVDGTFEFSLGGLCLLLAAYFFLMHRFAESWISNLLSIFFALVVIGGAFAVNRLVMTLKERVTFPRTGYVAYRKEPGARRGLRALLLAITAATVSSGMMLVIANRPPGFDWVVALSGLLLGTVIACLGLRTGLARFYLNAAVSLAAGLGLGWANLPQNSGVIAYYAIIGCTLLCLGGLTLWKYLRQNPAISPEEHEHAQ